MGLFDFDEEIEDLFAPEGEYEDTEENNYLRDADKALGLMGMVLNPVKNSFENRKRMYQIDKMMDNELLSAFEEIQLVDEVKMHRKLNQLSDKLAEQKRLKLLQEKVVIGLGGKFSAGKSKFINAILGVGDLLPDEQNPTTSIPTYIVQSQRDCIRAYTYDNGEMLLDADAMKALTHRFYEKYKVGFSSYISGLFIEKPGVPYGNIAFLDTPGYTKFDISTKKSVSDNQKAFDQLKTVDYLIWLVDIENGVVTQNDLEFISNLNLDTQVLIVFNKADKKDGESIQDIVNNSKRMVDKAGISCYGITAYSSLNRQEYFNRNRIQNFLDAVNAKKTGKEDLPNQIMRLEAEIAGQLEKKRTEAEAERNMLSDIIFQSNNVLEIRTLIDMYSESLDYCRTIYRCSNAFEKTKIRLNKALKEHFEEGA